MTDTTSDLLALEERFWAGGEDFFRQNVDRACLVAFTADMAGVMSNAELAATATNPNRWRDLDIDFKGIVEPADGVAILSYVANATRESGEPYVALVSSGYVKRRDGWKLMFHQQTPL